MAPETFLATFGLICLRLIELNGIDSQAFARQLGIDWVDIHDPKARLPASLVDVFFDKAASLIPDPAFALRVADCWHPSNLGALGYAWLSSRSLRSALRRLERFSKILGQRASCRCVDEPDSLRFVFDHGRGSGRAGEVIADFFLALIVAMCRMNYGAALRLESLNLRRSEPENSKPYEDYFACPIYFGASDDSFFLARRVADQSLPTANQEFAEAFDAILVSQLATLTGGDVVMRCREWLVDQLSSGEPSEQDLAMAMAMSRRTLQRRLAGFGMTYKHLLEKVRYDMALRYLGDAGKSITEITFLLGFSEQSAFSRAFKRWSGQAPTAYRERHSSTVK